uniref:Uncharacterized protein n=2 Tax=Oryza brachyantha TaxID=4533 RepID=J3L6K9_ORYBR
MSLAFRVSEPESWFLIAPEAAVARQIHRPVMDQRRSAGHRPRRRQTAADEEEEE